MKRVRQEYQERQVSSLTYHPRNPNQGDVGAIAESINATGFYGALIVQQSTGHVIAGNHRLMAAAHLDAETVPVIVVDVDDETALRIMVADNRMAELATRDFDELALILVELANSSGLDGTGYDGDDLDSLIADLDEPEGGWEDEKPAGNSLVVTFAPSDAEEVRELVTNAIASVDSAAVR